MVLQRFVELKFYSVQFYSSHFLVANSNFATSEGNCINSEFVLFHDPNGQI